MRHFLLPFLISLCPIIGQAQLLINEVMQSNIDCIMDDLKQFPDSWIELYNSGDTPIDLSKYKLSIDDYDHAWQMPSQTIGPRQRVLVYADKESTGMHAPFRLESGKGCTLYLFDLQGTVIDHLYIEKKQPAPNIAYGRQADGFPTWGYLYLATPGSANCGRICTEILGEPIFSEPGQVLTSARLITLTLTMPEGTPGGTQIRYTTDGSEPTQSSTLYSTPIRISNTKTIRAKAFHEGWLSPRSTTQSYLYLGRPMTLPVISITTDNAYIYDKQKGIYANPHKDWRRPINIEYFEEPESPSLLNQLGETRIQGGATRDAQYKSLAIYAHKRFGKKRFEYEFFPDQRPGDTDFKSLLLRNAGNDFDYLYMRDAIIQSSMAAHVDLDWQAWRPAIIYFNGTYTGMLNIRERSNADNVFTHYDGLEDIDMIENWCELKEGTFDNFNEFKAFYQEQGHTWEEYDALMDLDEYLNLMIMNLYFNNQDFPGNNFMMWRPREEGGRWRFIAKDTDFGLGLYGSSASYQTLKWIYDNSYDYNRNWANRAEDTRLFRRLMDDEHFKREFIDRCAIYMGTFLNYDGVWKVWEPMYDLIKTEYPNHRKLINQWWPNYNDELRTAQNWLRNRTSSFYTQLASFYNLGAPMPLHVNDRLTAPELEEISVSFNGVPIEDATFDGKFFANRSVTLQGGHALDADGRPLTSRTVIGWQVMINGTTTTYDGAQCQFTMPNSAAVFANAILGQDDGIEEITADKPKPASRYYDLMGRPISQPHGLFLESNMVHIQK